MFLAFWVFSYGILGIVIFVVVFLLEGKQLRKSEEDLTGIFLWGSQKDARRKETVKSGAQK